MKKLVILQAEIIPPIYDALIYWGMITIVVLTLAIVLWKVNQLLSHTSQTITILGGSIFLLAFPATIANAGVLSDLTITPPPFLGIIIYLFTVSIWLAVTRFSKSVRDDLNLMFLVGLQIFRLPLELLMHEASERGIMPEMLSFSGLNYDILTGAGALFIVLVWIVRAISQSASPPQVA